MHATAFALLAGVPVPPSILAADTEPSPYLRRGDEVEKNYRAYREVLESFFTALDARLELSAPDLRRQILPPAPVPYGYQLLPQLLVETPWQPRPARVILSPFSWSRTEELVTRDSARLTALRARLEAAPMSATGTARSECEAIVGEYRKLVDGQKLMESQIQYNRLWQGEAARNPRPYEDAKALQAAALERQRLRDSPIGPDEAGDAGRARLEALTRQIEAALRKSPAPAFVQAEHPDRQRRVLRVPVYTDIEDAAFVERFRGAIEGAWHVRTGEDDYAVALDIRPLAPSQLYADADPPAKGAHIDVGAHLKRFPPDGAVLTTGANTIYSLGRGIVLGPHAVGPSALVHEFGHILGFRDGYFRSAQDRGPEGYEIVEVILDPEDVVAAPEHGRVRREHFELLLQEERP